MACEISCACILHVMAGMIIRFCDVRNEGIDWLGHLRSPSLTVWLSITDVFLGDLDNFETMRWQFRKKSGW